MLLPGTATIAASFYAQEAFPAWPWWKLLIYCVLVFDIVGGIVTNASSSAKRWFHRDTQTWRDHLGFVALHIVQIAIVATLFRDLDWSYGPGARNLWMGPVSGSSVVHCFPVA